VTWALIAVAVAPLAGAVLSFVDGWRSARAVTLAAGIATLALTVALAIEVAGGRTLVTAGGWIRLDSLGAVFLVGTGLLYAMAAVFSVGYFAGHETEHGFLSYSRRYYALLNLFGWTMVLVPLASDFGILWVAVELTTIVSALLVAIDRTDAALEAAWKYVLIASSGLGIALLAIIFVYASGTAALGDAYVPRFDRLFAVAGSLPDDTVRFAFVLALVGFGTKAGFVPTHTWLPDAHSEAPAPVSAMLSGSLLAAALYAILRFFQVAVAAGDRVFAEHLLIVFGAVSLVAASLFVLRQPNFKRLLAYSSIEHMGIIALGVGFGAPLAVAGALLHVLTHASAKGLAFLGAGSLLRRYDTKEVDGVTGAAAVLPYSGPMFLAAILALCGLPISGVFRSEFQIVSGGFASSDYVGVAILLVFVNVAFFGLLWHATRMVLSAPDATIARGEVSGWMVAAMAGCLLVVIALGLHVPDRLSELLNHAVALLHGPAA
jgi:hydrogenase-4 component F